jgi:hypothetical protein
VAVLGLAAVSLVTGQESSKGWIEGTVATEQGAATFVCGGAVSVMAKPQSGTGFKTNADSSLGGFYTLRDIPPGVYEIFVSASTTALCQGEPVAPVHVRGIVVKPGARTMVNVVLHKGQTLEELGSTSIQQSSSPKSQSLEQRLDELQKQIDDLREEIKKR